MTRRASWILLCLGLSAGGALAVAGQAPEQAAEPESSAREASSPYMRAVRDREARAKAPDPLVFSNDDLEERFGPPPELPPEVEEPAAVASEEQPPPAGEAEAKAGSAAEAAAASPDAPPDALQQLADEQASAVERGEKLAEAERKVEQARERITTLERRMLALRNPLLARPEAPEKDREAWDGADNQERLTRSQNEMADAQKALGEAEQELVRLQSTP